jgi:hypothetical protein
MNDLELCGWADAASPGDRVVYHRGAIADSETCRTAMLLSERGEIHVNIRPTGEATSRGSRIFEYLATKATKRRE